MNYKRLLLFVFFYILEISLFAQKEKDTIHAIDEVVIETQRLQLPFSKKSHTISIVSSKDIAQTTASSLDEVLQRVVGVDIRRRGVEGMQSDLYIRGGNFNQVLLLIDGIKMDDMQTGHHTMNGMLALENIQRIEIIKGAAARIYGQNAMNGAINIVTKKVKQDKYRASFSVGSYENVGVAIGFQKVLPKGAIQVHLNKRQSEGYRFNTDFDNWNAFLKTKWNNYEFLASFTKRDFGANGFYASPDFKDQYEETQTNLVALKRKFKGKQWHVNTNAYWRQNRDMYLFLRQNPEYYKNIHINNKYGVSIDATHKNQLGATGIGLDFNQGYLKSNNLGDHIRFTSTLFLEHRFQLFNEKLDITPGMAMAYYSDIKTFFYPGIDIGYRFSNQFKLYANAGYTSRIPTYTNLYYESQAEKGNPNLKPEKAFTYESGFYLSNDSFHLNLALFRRNANDLIDWTKDIEEGIWEARNFAQVTTKGFEVQGSYTFNTKDFQQSLSLGYTHLDDSILDKEALYSRYSINSYRHQVSSQINTQFFPFLRQQVSYRFAERIDGTRYHLVDAAMDFTIKKWSLSLKANNIFNTEYSETNLVPMPKANFMLMTSYTF